ncbi:hypothetical protein RvY_15482-2 [Ramazzottius varieornatus]|uniref:Uncharacterized protein n=1 Tax=Ramazzottius varieornatus TaxID=947166 RepID=A0A1D1VV45_RAMVA|nr:hypothetical protein RvY_15482-2 [Ramazzottius varieornatus]
MASRGVGRGTAFGRGIRFEALPDSAATGASQAAGRGFPIHRAAAQPAQPDIAAFLETLTTQTPGRKLTKDGEERRARGDLDIKRPFYRIPKRSRIISSLIVDGSLFWSNLAGKKVRKDQKSLSRPTTSTFAVTRL